MSIQVGNKVRVSRKEGEGWAHGIKFGAVCTVLELHPAVDEVLVRGPLLGSAWNPDQYVSMQSIKLAKQANKRSAP